MTASLGAAALVALVYAKDRPPLALQWSLSATRHRQCCGFALGLVLA